MPCVHHIQKERRKKLDAKSELGILIGCLPHRQYKLWIPSRGVAVLSRDVTIVENRFPSKEGYISIDNSISDPILSPGSVPTPVSTVRPQQLRTDVEDLSATANENTSNNEEQHAPTEGNDEEQAINGSDGEDDIADENVSDGSMHLSLDPDRPYVVSSSGRKYPQLDMRSQDAPVMEQRRYPERKRAQTTFYSPGASNVTVQGGTDVSENMDPLNVEEAMNRADWSEWSKAITSEMKSLDEHGTWQIVDKPEGARILSTRFVFVRKQDADGNITRYKARLVVRGFQQGFVEKTYAPVVDFTTVRLCLALAVQRNYSIQQLDVKTAFLHGDIDGEVYVYPPEGIAVCEEGKVLKLLKGLYGLKQAPRLWYDKWNEVMNLIGFEILRADPCVYRRNDVTVLLYVDDIIITAPRKSVTDELKASLNKHFDVQELGTLNYFLGITFSQTDEFASLSQAGYTRQILERFGMAKCNPVTTPMSMHFYSDVNGEHVGTLVDQQAYQEELGCLLYLSTRTRPDISAAVSILARYAAEPRAIHKAALKRVMRYLRGTINFGLVLSRTTSETLSVYSDSDWAGDRHDRKSTSGILCRWGESTISWKTMKQISVALSTTEAEFCALSEATKLVVWLRYLTKELGIEQAEATTIYEDNRGAEIWATEGVRNAKHISIRRNFVLESVKNHEVEVKSCPTVDMLADFLTKPLPRVKFTSIRDRIGMRAI